MFLVSSAFVHGKSPVEAAVVSQYQSIIIGDSAEICGESMNGRRSERVSVRVLRLRCPPFIIQL